MRLDFVFAHFRLNGWLQKCLETNPQMRSMVFLKKNSFIVLYFPM